MQLIGLTAGQRVHFKGSQEDTGTVVRITQQAVYGRDGGGFNTGVSHGTRRMIDVYTVAWDENPAQDPGDATYRASELVAIG